MAMRLSHSHLILRFDFIGFEKCKDSKDILSIILTKFTLFDLVLG